MSTYTLPAPDAPAEDWGRLAVSIPGWRWMPGILNGADGTRYVGNGAFAWEDPHRHHASGIGPDDWPDPDDPATAGCLLALLGRCAVYDDGPVWVCEHDRGRGFGATPGRACIAVVAALRPWRRSWPGGGA